MNQQIPRSPTKQQPKPDYRLKVVMVGNSAVGKSSMISSYMDNNFQFNTVPTLGIDFKFKEMQINNKIVQMQLWDTAGQDNFQAITKTYYKGADAVVLVYDITNPDSFQSIKNYWYHEVVNHADAQVEIMVLANKLDLDSERKVSYQDGLNFCKENNFIFREVTATEPQLIHEAFVRLLEVVLPNRRSLQENKNKLTKKLNNRQNEKTCWQKFLAFF